MGFKGSRVRISPSRPSKILKAKGLAGGAEQAHLGFLGGIDGRAADLALVSRKVLVPRDVPAVVASAGPNALVVSPYLGDRTRELLAAAGVSYADATGNVRIVVISPSIFLESSGTEKDPARTPRPLHSLRGAAHTRRSKTDRLRRLARAPSGLGKGLQNCEQQPHALVPRAARPRGSLAEACKCRSLRGDGVDCGHERCAHATGDGLRR